MNALHIKRCLADFWDQAGADYDDFPRHGLQSTEEERCWLSFLREILPKEGKKILDVGAGTGFLSLLIAKLGYEVKSTDLSEKMLAQAREKAVRQALSDRISFCVEDAENLADQDGMYDAVVNRHLLWTLPHPAEAITEWLRVTKPGGKVIIIDADWYQEDPSVRSSAYREKADKKRKEGSYPSELYDVLPLVSGEQTAWELLQQKGCRVRKDDLLDQVEEAERKMIRERNFQGVDCTGRFVFVIEKGDEGFR